MAGDPVGRLACVIPPHTGGLYTFFLRLRNALENVGWEVYSVELGDERTRYYGYDTSVCDLRHIRLNGDGESEISVSKALVDWLTRNDINVLMLLPVSAPAAYSAIAHLPPEVHVISRCSEISPINYRHAAAAGKRASAIVTTAPRQRRDLIKSYGVGEDRIWLIPNGVDVARFRFLGKQRGDLPLRVAYLDRIDPHQKNPMMLPKILKILDRRNIKIQLDVAGDGPALLDLKEALHPWISLGRARCHGAITWEQVPAFLSAADILVKTTNNEGSPSSVLEAMSCGAVPICSHISGVTDFVVAHGKTGLLCRIGSSDDFARAIATLDADHKKLDAMSSAARRSVEENFSIESFNQSWTSLMSWLLSTRPPLQSVRPWSEYRRHPVFERPLSNQFFFRFFPRRLKNRTREMLERNNLHGLLRR